MRNLRSFEEIGKFTGSDALNEAYQVYASLWLDYYDDNLNHFIYRNHDVRPLLEKEAALKRIPTDNEKIEAYKEAIVSFVKLTIVGEVDSLDKLMEEYPWLKNVEAEIKEALSKK